MTNLNSFEVAPRSKNEARSCERTQSSRCSPTSGTFSTYEPLWLLSFTLFDRKHHIRAMGVYWQHGYFIKSRTIKILGQCEGHYEDRTRPTVPR
jgi:hypothetical protein